jgi:hypothetical protein
MCLKSEKISSIKIYRMYFSIPYDEYQNYFKGSLIRLKWVKDMKMFQTVNEKEHDLGEDILKYKVTFFYCPYVDKDDFKEHGAKWCNDKKMWYYVGNNNIDFFKKYRVISSVEEI